MFVGQNCVERYRDFRKMATISSEKEIADRYRDICVSIKALIGNLFVNRHQQATGDGLPAMGYFHFRDAETLKGHPRSKSLRILNPCYQVPFGVPK